ncbi:multidrug resistance-associated protein 7-like protein, partial [Dinothrombium tinctorium]
MNYSNFCGKSTFKFWSNETYTFGQCFIDAFIAIPINLLFIAVSVYFCGTNVRLSQQSNSSTQHRSNVANALRVCLSIALLITAIGHYLVASDKYSLHTLIAVATQVISWITHIAYVSHLFKTSEFKAQRNAAFFLTLLFVLIANGIYFYNAVVSTNLNASTILIDRSIVVHFLSFLFHTLYICVFLCQIFHHSTLQNYVEFTDDHREDNGLIHDLRDVNMLHEEINEENANFISKITFWWVNDLMKRGVRSLLKSPADLCLLPVDLTSNVIHKNAEKMKNRFQESVKLLRLLFATFGTKFALIGILKFIADILGFAGPLLLNNIILYLEDKNRLKPEGFYFAFGLFFSTLIASFSITLFNYRITNATLKVKSTLICLIYEKMFKVSSQSLLSAFSIGEILNFSSTDTDRIASFCPNLLQLFSLPIQLAVSLCLLYTQLGLSFFSGLAFAIVILPINKWICDKIGQLSTKMMEFKDKRIKKMSEILSGIRILKMHAWEEKFGQSVEAIRKKEMKYMKGRKFLDAICVYLWATTPVIISWLSFTTFVLLGNKLNSAKVFTSLALFNMLIMPLNALPWVLNGVIEAWVSIKRIQKFLLLEEICFEDHYNLQPLDDNPIVAENAIFQRKFAENVSGSHLFTLGPISFSIKRGTFIGVIGEVGTGKSSLLSAMIGELLRIDGNFGINRAELTKGIGFVSQEPFIQNGTIRSNILFGKTFDFNLYNSVLDTCALLPDFEMLPNKDNSQVGDRGVALSGGQKSRIALARALYQEFNVYLLDDPFASVDIHVAKHIYTKCIMQMLGEKTRILCTHHVEFLHEADIIFVMKNGMIAEHGAPNVVLNSDEYKKLSEIKINKEESKELIQSETFSDMSEEEKEEGIVKLSVYQHYLKAIGPFLTISILISFTMMQFSRTFSDWWLAHWTSRMKHNDTSATNMRYLEYFAAIAAANSVLTLVRAFLFAIGGIVAAIYIHNVMLKSILLCSVKFFDTKSFGRTITRFSSDLFNVDDALPFTLNIFLAQTFSLAASLFITVYGIPWIALILLLLAFPYYYIQWYYRWTSRDLKRLCAITLAPIYSIFAETFHGLSTIRSFNCTNRFTCDLYGKLDACNTTQYAANAASQWLNLRLQLLGVFVTSAVAFSAVSLHYFKIQQLEAGFIGLALAYSLSITSLLNGVVQTLTQVETDMVSVERIQHYVESSNKEPEGGSAPENWPNNGEVVFNNVSMRYKANSPLVLSNVNFKINSKEFVGIVGRTGSGKSSLFQCLFRLVTPETGNIIIDGVDISNLDLKILRSNLCIIPQDSFLFGGSLRENIDPMQQYSDSAIWKALRDCSLEAFVLSVGGLGINLNECGQDLSVGQKQLLCLARACLSCKKIICLDEATAAIDYKAENIIYQTIRRSFQNSTILMIAHKIESVLKCDKVIVMNNGKVAEIGPPNDLLNNKESLLYQ